jgi:hypothetical protein
VTIVGQEKKVGGGGQKAGMLSQRDTSSSRASFPECACLIHRSKNKPEDFIRRGDKYSTRSLSDRPTWGTWTRLGVRAGRVEWLEKHLLFTASERDANAGEPCSDCGRPPLHHLGPSGLPRCNKIPEKSTDRKKGHLVWLMGSEGSVHGWLVWWLLGLW